MNAHQSSFPVSVDAGIPRLGECPSNWRRVKIGELFKPAIRPVVMADDETYDLVTVGRARSGIRFRSRNLGSEIAVKSQFELAEGDFLISKRQVSHRAVAVVSAEFAGSIVSNEYSVLRPTDQLSLRYFWWFAHSRYIQQTLFYSSIGVHVEKLIFKLEDWFKWEVHLPPLEEQRKIAAFLDAVEERIKLAERRRDGLADYKRGLMQALFSRRLRFRRDDGTAFPEWERTRLGNVVTFMKGRGVSKDDIDPEGVRPCIRYGEIYTAYGETITRVHSRTQSAADHLLSEHGDIVMPSSGEDATDIARACAVMVEDVALGGDTIVLRGAGVPVFLSHLLSHGLKREIARLGQGNSVVHLYAVHLKDIEIHLC